MGKFEQGAIGFVSDLINFITLKDWVGAGIDTDSIGKSLCYFLADIAFVGIVNGVFEKEESCDCHFVHG